MFGNYADYLNLTNYRRLIRPIGNNNSERLTVKVGLKLIQILDLDEKNQIMKTNVFLYQEWYDKSLRWDPDQYNGINSLDIPNNIIW